MASFRGRAFKAKSDPATHFRRPRTELSGRAICRAQVSIVVWPALRSLAPDARPPVVVIFRSAWGLHGPKNGGNNDMEWAPPRRTLSVGRETRTSSRERADVPCRILRSAPRVVLTPGVALAVGGWHEEGLSPPRAARRQPFRIAFGVEERGPRPSHSGPKHRFGSAFSYRAEHHPAICWAFMGSPALRHARRR